MAKRLSEMTLEELWQLFPIVLTPHQESWNGCFLQECARLTKVLPDAKISHIGSTAVSSIWAKPIIDILVEVSEDGSLLEYKDLITNNGYICMSESEKGLSFNKGYTENGFAEQVFHLHLRYAGDNDELYFRDYLNDCPSVAKEYEKLKLLLWKEYEHNRDAYTNAKTEFVKTHTNHAKKLYGKRY